jgi:phosphoglucosamine mutase
MAICALQMMKEGRLRKKTLVATVMSNLGLEIALQTAGGKLVRAPVGDRYVMEKMLEGGYNLGGEQSGHVIFLDHNTTGDGLISALQILAIMKQTGKPLSELAACMKTYPQTLVNVKVKERRDLMSIPEIAQRMAEVEKKLGSSGRLLVRYSGTEPKVRVMIEGEDARGSKRLPRILPGSSGDARVGSAADIILVITGIPNRHRRCGNSESERETGGSPVWRTNPAEGKYQ